MLTASKKQKLLDGIREYRKQFFHKELSELDESGTRIMVNTMLTGLLCYKALEEIRTEYMIKGTYADYVVQIDGKRHMLVEVKALPLALSDKHLRQAVNYAANEGIEWAMLTNGRILQLYRVLFEQPIEAKLVFDIDLSNQEAIKKNAECLQYLHKESVIKDGLDDLWNHFIATEKTTIASLVLSRDGIAFLAKQLRVKFKTRFDEKVIIEAARRMVSEPVDLEDVKPHRSRSGKNKKNVKIDAKEPVISQPVATVMTTTTTGKT